MIKEALWSGLICFTSCAIVAVLGQRFQMKKGERLINEALKDVKAEAFFYGQFLKAKDMAGIDIETSGKGGYETDWNPWVPGHPVSGLFGNVYELKGTDGNVLTVIADFQELGYNFFAPPSYFKCHLSDGTTLRVPYRDIVSHRLKAGFEEHPITKTQFLPDCDEITLDAEPEGPKPSSIGLASPTEDELANFITRCKPNNRSLKSLTLFLRRFESYLAMYERKFKVDRTYRSSCEYENVSNVPKQVSTVLKQDEHHRRRRRRM